MPACQLQVLAGVEALEHFKGILLVFAGVLVFSSAKLLTEGAEDEGEDEDLSENGIISVARKMVSAVDYYDGSNFFTYVRPHPRMPCIHKARVLEGASSR